MGKGMISIGKQRKIKKSKKYSMLNQEEITWYIENDLDLNEYYNKLEEKEQNAKWGGKKKKK